MNEQPWTPLVGLRRALSHLVIRAAIALVLWTAVVWLITPVLNFLVPHWSIFGLITVVMAVPGVAIGHALAKNLTDTAGMSGLPVAVMAIAFGWAVVILGVVLAHTIRPVGDWQYGFTVVATGCSTTLWLIKATLLQG